MSTTTSIAREEGARFAARLNANAAIIYPGHGRSFELDFDTEDHLTWNAVLLELVDDGTRLEPRTMTIGGYPSPDEAGDALGRELEKRAAAVLRYRESEQKKYGEKKN